jgi:type III pantothenate kinase
MLLVIDIGNTNITMGLWDGREWRRHWRLRTVHDQTVDEYGVYLKTLLSEVAADKHVNKAVMASVVPPLTATFTELCCDYLGLVVLQVKAGTKTGIQVLTDNPAEVGADRIANAVAAHQMYPGPSIVVDMGTATTFDAISGEGELLGVAISPGLGLAAAALSDRAAQLSRVALEAPPNAIGRNTIQAMQSGLIFGYTALIEGMVTRFKGEMAAPDAQVIGTGGLIPVIQSLTTVIDHVEPWFVSHLQT